MKTSKKKTTILTAALSGLVLGSTLSLQGCKSGDSNAGAAAEKHACAGLNTCKDKGGCKDDNGCGGKKNECTGKGTCATVKHACAGKNDCKNQGGCKGADGKGTPGKNTCQGKGGCAVPIKDHK